MAAFALFNAGTQAALYSTVASARQFYSPYQRTIVPVGGVVTQRIEGGSRMYKKNTAAKFAFKAVDTDGNGVTGLTITAKTGIDGAAPTTASNSVVQSGSGWYYITLTAGEMNGDLIVLDLSASGATIAPITISTESDYTAARAGFLDAAVTSRLAGASYTAPDNASISAIGAIVGSGTYGNAAIKTAVDGISVATNAGDMATKQADSATLTTGSTISGTYASTATNDSVYWITAPVTPAVGGFGLRQQLVFDLPLGRTPVGIQVRGYFNGSSNAVDVYALNSRTAVFDKLTNSNTNLASRNSDALYSIPLPRDYADDSGGLFNIVTLEFRAASTNTAHRLRVDQALIAHVAEDVAVTSTAPTAEQIWSYVSRELTSPGVEPVTVPTASEVADEVQTRTIAAVTTVGSVTGNVGGNVVGSVASVVGAVGSVTGLTASNLDATISSRLASASYTAPPSAATNATAVRTELGTELGRIDVATSTRLASGSYTAPDNASIAAIGGIVTGIAGDVTDVLADTNELQTEWADGGRLDLILDSAASGGSAPTAVEIADEVATRTLDANIKKVNNITISGTGAPGDTWGP